MSRHGRRAQSLEPDCRDAAPTCRKSRRYNRARLRTAILDGIEAANQAVLTLGNGSASTLALAELGPGYVRTYHVGDSIVLLCGQRGAVKLMTTPHSPVGFAMEAGLIDESEALQHAELNLIFNVIGSADMRIEIGSETPVAPRDTLLIASDGLTDNVLQEEIIELIRTGPVENGIDAITALARSRMLEEQPCAVEPVSVESLLNEMTDRDSVARFPETDFRLKQHSSYSRESRTLVDPEGWFMNHDFNRSPQDRNFIRIEENQGQREWVLMDHEGPGTLVRTWMPWRSQQSSASDTTDSHLSRREQPNLFSRGIRWASSTELG